LVWDHYQGSLVVMSKNVIYAGFALPLFEGLIIKCVKPIWLQSNLDRFIHSIVLIW
jgi:hypothetical protein